MKTSLLYLISALLFTLFLGFIDEGYYSFAFLQDAGNILVLSFYLLVFWAVQLLADHIQVRYLPGVNQGMRRSLAIALGLIAPVAVILLLFSNTN